MKSLGQTMKLELHLVPQSCFYSNLRKVLKSNWTQLSKDIRGKADLTCQICGWRQGHSSPVLGRRYTELHEVWEYDEEKKVQKLVEFECLCPACHAVHHWGYSQVSGKDMDFLMYHACHVNGCSKSEFTQHLIESKEIWERRSFLSWKTDFGEWWHLVPEDSQKKY